MRMRLYWVIILFTLFVRSTVAQTQEERDEVREKATSALQQPKPSTSQIDDAPLTDLGDEYTNSISLLQNRFRVDYNVSEVTMIFFREYGSAPVVLVRPDGSKLFQSTVDEEKVKWFDADTFDMITIKNPVPGPWQAVGEVLPDSRVMVLSNIELKAEALPELLFAGEILKSTAYLTNNGKPIENSQFRDVVELDIEFVSSNNPNYDNFGANKQNIATFEDNGRGMDERPGDGIFTGQFNLKITPGEWKPIFRVKTPMYTREQTGELIVLHENPVTVAVEQHGGGEGYHKIIIDVDRELVDIESFLVDGKVKFPNADMQNFSLTEGGSQPREHLIVAYEEGIFRVKVTAYGTTIDGRDFILDVPEFSFVASDPEEQEIAEMTDDSAKILEEGIQPQEERAGADSPPTLPSTPEDEGMDNDTLIFWIAAVNGSIVVVGILCGVIIVLLRKRKNPPPTSGNDASSANSAPADKITDAELTMESDKKGIQKLLAIFKKKNKSNDTQ